MKIGIDLDEVIADFMDALLIFYHKKKQKLHNKNEFKEYKFWPVWGITREEAIKLVDEFHETNKLDDVKPAELAVQEINSLLKNGDELYVITARPIRFKQKVEDWIKYHLKTEKIEVIHAGDFHKDQASTKAEICKELGIKIILEDLGETAVQCAESGIKVILFDKPWNKNFSHNNIIRLNNWKEVAKELNKLRNVTEHNN